MQVDEVFRQAGIFRMAQRVEVNDEEHNELHQFLYREIVHAVRAEWLLAPRKRP